MRQRLLHKFTASRKGFGIHSPFLFEFQRKVLHPKGENKNVFGEINKEQDKILRVILRIYIFFSLKTPIVLVEKIQKGFEKYGVEYKKTPTPLLLYDLAVVDASEYFSKKWLKDKAFVILIGNYKKIQQHTLSQECTVFLNLYHIGICIFKQGLSKQTFKLKL